MQWLFRCILAACLFVMIAPFTLTATGWLNSAVNDYNRPHQAFEWRGWQFEFNRTDWQMQLYRPEDDARTLVAFDVMGIGLNYGRSPSGRLDIRAYVCVLWLLPFGIGAVYAARGDFRLRNRSPALCRQCDYDLRGNPGAHACPECGAARLHSVPASP